MSKRTLKPENCLSKRPKNWFLGLLDTMNDPAYIVKQTDRVVVIKDKYPKAKYHYLILPRDDIGSIYKLNKTHITLLEEFGVLYEDLKCEHKGVELKAGFHAVPSLHRVHMHVISKDMISDCLKTKQHWNSFNTSFFIPYLDALAELKENGSIKTITSEQHKNLLGTQLQCNQCTCKLDNMPKLKKHLLIHYK